TTASVRAATASVSVIIWKMLTLSPPLYFVVSSVYRRLEGSSRRLAKNLPGIYNRGMDINETLNHMRKLPDTVASETDRR
ncbi:hypothetical protein ACFQBR_33580, partial [Nocardiopsis tropica]|uniref:hypothetical protein n=1 Tax=Nocardiopsis tropica TaxID=109330 RepID=UPI00360FA8EC